MNFFKKLSIIVFLFIGLSSEAQAMNIFASLFSRPPMNSQPTPSLSNDSDDDDDYHGASSEPNQDLSPSTVNRDQSYSVTPSAKSIASSAAKFFYARLPEFNVVSWDYDHTQSYINDAYSVQLDYDLVRDPVNDQSALLDALNKMRLSPVADDPFFQVGLSQTSKIILIKDIYQVTGFVGSPSQFDSDSNTIFINESDLAEYGVVVVFHELIQSGLYNSLNQGYITEEEYLELMALNQLEFNSYQGYVGNLPDPVLSAGKAFAIGYTYYKLNRYFQSLNSKDQDQINLFNQDLNQNSVISYMNQSGNKMPICLITCDFESNGSFQQSDVQNFLDIFSNTSSSILTKIEKIAEVVGENEKRHGAARLTSAMSLLF